MRPVVHLSCGALLGGVNYLLNRETDTSAACVFGAVLCDTDHILEYREYCRKYKVKPDFGEWSSGKYFTKKGTVKVIFHSWELCALSWILLWIMGLYGNTGFFGRSGRKDGAAGLGFLVGFLFRIFKGFTIGYTSHMILDQLGNGLRGKSYFLFYRLLHGWRQKEL